MSNVWFDLTCIRRYLTSRHISKNEILYRAKSLDLISSASTPRSRLCTALIFSLQSRNPTCHLLACNLPNWKYGIIEL